jgi:osmotically-inducible protein OsmY
MTAGISTQRKVSRRKSTYAFACALIVAGALTGCATYRKCGFDGCPGDAKITADVRALLDQYPALEGSNTVYVQTLDHAVYLSGLVDTPFQRQFAQSVALQAPGAARVVNMIGVSNQR